jgi:ribonuclease HI
VAVYLGELERSGVAVGNWRILLQAGTSGWCKGQKSWFADRVQQLAVITLTGAMHTMATNVLEANAKLMPIDQCIQMSCHRVALHMAALPPIHPLHPLLRQVAKSYVKCHRSSLHYLTHSFDIKPELIEMIIPIQKNPMYSSPYTTKIPRDKDEAIKEHNKITTGTKVYCDGSGIDGHIGAAAVLYTPHEPPKTLQYYLGKVTEHTVYEAEAVGLSIAAKLLLSERDVETLVSIFIDNQAVIQAGACFTSKPSHYLIDHASRLIHSVQKKHRLSKTDITVRWIMGHSEVEGNEHADVEAKRALKDGPMTTSRNQLPCFL